MHRQHWAIHMAGTDEYSSRNLLMTLVLICVFAAAMPEVVSWANLAKLRLAAKTQAWVVLSTASFDSRVDTNAESSVHDSVDFCPTLFAWATWNVSKADEKTHGLQVLIDNASACRNWDASLLTAWADEPYPWCGKSHKVNTVAGVNKSFANSSWLARPGRYVDLSANPETSCRNDVIDIDGW